jgi:hypothetical protein
MQTPYEIISVSMFHTFDSSKIKEDWLLRFHFNTFSFRLSFRCSLFNLICALWWAKIRTFVNIRLLAHRPSRCVTYLSDYTIPYSFEIFSTSIAYCAHADTGINSLLHGYTVLPNWSNLLQGKRRLFHNCSVYPLQILYIRDEELKIWEFV